MTIRALILDGCVLAALILLAVWGGKQGLFKAVFGIFAGLLGLLLTWRLYPYMADLLTAFGLKTSIQNGLAERLLLPQTSGLAQQNAAIEGLALPQMIKDWLIQNNNSEAYGALGAAGFTEYVAAYLANMAVNILAVLITFVLSLLLCRLLSGLLGFINKLPVIGGLNRVLGVVLGVAVGLIVIWSILLLFTFLGLTTRFASLTQMIEESKLSFFLYKHNLLMDISSQIFR